MELSTLARPTRALRPFLLAVAALTLAAAVFGVLPSMTPANASTTNLWLNYGGKSANVASIPGSTVTLSPQSSVPMDSVTLSIGSTTLGVSSEFRAVGGTYAADVVIDLSPYSGRTWITARYTSGTKKWSIRKVVRVVPASLTTTPPTTPLVPSTAAVTTTPTPGPTANPSMAPAPTAVPTPASPTTTSPPPSAQSSAPATATGTPVLLEQPGPMALPGLQPDGSNTGVPAGTVLTPSGGLYLVTPGQVISNLDIDGCVVVLANDITLRNVRITCSNPRNARVVEVGRSVTGLVIEDSEIFSPGAADIAIGWSNYTLRRVNIHGTCDGARANSDVIIESSWIHDLVRMRDLHCDAIQSTEGSNIVVRGNTLVPTNSTGDLLNAAIMLGSETGTRQLNQVLVENNWLGGGNYSINVRNDTTFNGITFRGNIYTGGARYGPALAPPGVVFEGNGTTSSAPWRLVLTR